MVSTVGVMSPTRVGKNCVGVGSSVAVGDPGSRRVGVVTAPVAVGVRVGGGVARGVGVSEMAAGARLNTTTPMQ